MTRRLCLAPLAAALLMTPIATGTASADRVAVKPRPRRVRRPMPVPMPVRYKVDLIGERGQRLSTFRRRGATYVLGARGQRYAIRIHNPTAQRVEAVVSVDGLDVIDGKTANYRKRGYVIPAYGQVTIDGFRTSMSQVAAFRFSSVSNSYAVRKGKSAARVGVIKVALFQESTPMIIRRRRYYNKSKRYRYQKRPSPRRSGAAKPSADMRSSRGRAMPRRRRYRPPTHNPGLGTKFGERRQSSVRYTSFTRRSNYAPNRLITLRYNNRAGLVAMGILPGNGVQIAR